VVFSGGKLEYRKGQDIVVAAFREFHRRHPESILVTAWQNHWPKTMEGIDHKGYVHGTPTVGSDGQIDITGWLEANGVPRSASHNLGVVPNYLMPKVYLQVDAAVFPNRCEGGTNLAAMECLACGLPTVLSANTGHLDLIDAEHCYPLKKQGRVDAIHPYQATQGWGESQVDELVESLERIHGDSAEAAKRGAASVRFMEDWSWKKRFEELVQHLQRTE
jgi:glycosyltransferase involved in cell wall biosynthesis